MLLVILICITVLGGTGYVAYEVGQKTSQSTSQEEFAATTSAAVATSSLEEPIGQAPAAPVQVQTSVSVSATAESLIEKCKALREASRARLWPATLEMVKLAEQQTYQSRLNAFMATIQPGVVTASDLSNAAKISVAEHEKNLATAQSMMDAQLSKEYSTCVGEI